MGKIRDKRKTDSRGSIENLIPPNSMDQNAVIVGDRKSISFKDYLSAQKYPFHRKRRVNVIGLVETGDNGFEGNNNHCPLLGNIGSLRDICREREVREIYVHSSDLTFEGLVNLVEGCPRDLKVKLITQNGSLLKPLFPSTRVNGFKLLSFHTRKRSLYYRIFKRCFDFLGSVLLLILASPILLISAVLIRYTSRGPIIYKQRRIGKDGKEFLFYKFRTMQVDNDDTIHREYLRKLICRDSGKEHCIEDAQTIYKIKNDPRVTSVGRFLRKWSIDELPQLFNVLKGEMSLIGPRPPIYYETEYYEDWHWQRLSVLPGITGFWQVCGRSRVRFDEMVFMDIFYIKNISFFTDLKIMFKTIPAVLFSKGAY
jgi:exopolysaccharide biosynthesis polyprenyl glycosylphosphotransferase